MANHWFKFYGGEYLSDPKILSLTAPERSCWITLMCYASVTDGDGVVSHLGEKTLMIQAGISADGDEWKNTVGVLDKFEKMGMITQKDGQIALRNWKKRQEMMLTGAERTRRYRERLRNKSDDRVTEESHGSDARREENRIDKKRIEEKRVEKSRYLSAIPEKDMKEFLARFNATKKEIESKAEDLLLYCKRKNKWYNDYKAFLLNALKRDFKVRDDTAKGGKYKHLT
jgi:hypothetical protein